MGHARSRLVGVRTTRPGHISVLGRPRRHQTRAVRRCWEFWIPFIFSFYFVVFVWLFTPSHFAELGLHVTIHKRIIFEHTSAMFHHSIGVVHHYSSYRCHCIDITCAPLQFTSLSLYRHYMCTITVHIVVIVQSLHFPQFLFSSLKFQLT